MEKKLRREALRLLLAKLHRSKLKKKPPEDEDDEDDDDFDTSAPGLSALLKGKETASAART